MKTKENCTVPGPDSPTQIIPEFMPLSDFEEPPSLSPPKRNDTIRREFLEAYYQQNVETARLLAAGPDSPGESRRGLERSHERVRELEDQYLPFGVVAEPTLAQGFVVNVSFTFPDESRWFAEQQARHSWRVEVQISPPRRCGELGQEAKQQNS